MVQAVINVDDHINRVLNIIKAKFGLRDKSAAISLVVNQYEKIELEPTLRPSYQTKITKIMQGRHLSRKELERVVA